MKFLRYEDIKNNKHFDMIKNMSDENINIISHVYYAITNAFDMKSKINATTKEGEEILDYIGMTGLKTRHLYNNLLNFENAKYLEIGTWHGSSSISAVYKNKVKALFIDNWSEFGGDINIFTNSLEKYLTPESEYKFIEGNCWEIDTSKIDKDFNIYLYDGGHEEHEHADALKYYYNNMSNVFIFIVDDWCWGSVRDGTWRGIKECNLKIRFCEEIFVSQEDMENWPNNKSKYTWWNGVGIFVLEK